MKLKKGINLGGYLSQCCHEETHYDTFILEEDIKQIADWGFDHVRLPIDYEVLETKEGTVIEKGYERVRKVIGWCQRNGLNIILDLHKAYGYDFNDAGNKEKNNLFSSKELQDRFVTLWARMASHFGKEDNVAFELLNEVVENENAEAWNDLIRETISPIRKEAPTTPIIYGGIQWNSVSTLKLLEVPKDPNIIFTFHFYEPLLFTHQKAPWVATIDPKETIFYPQSMEDYKEKSAKIGDQGLAVVNAKSKTMGPEFIEEMVEEAIRAAQNAGVSLYCGEFGVIDRAPVEDTLRWFQDVDSVFSKYDIGMAVWSYKKMDFGIIEKHYESIKEDLISLWCR